MQVKLKALLVDDEVNILRNLQAIIPWESLDIEIYDAKNGVQALEMAAEVKPDLILSDIRMPVMDGITLLQKVREQELACEVILLTGYQDFEYARSGIRLAARDYILKPIDYEELERAIVQTAADIRMKKLEHKNEQKKWGAAFRLAYEKMLYDVLGCSTVQCTTLLALEDELEVEQLSYVVLFVDLDAYTQEYRQWSESERKLWNFAVRNVLEEVLAECRISHAIVQLREGEWCVLVQWYGNQPDSELLLEHAKSWVRSMQEAVRQFNKKTISVAVYPRAASLEELPGVYRHTQYMLHQTPNRADAFVIAERSKAACDDPHVPLWNDVEGMISGLKQMDRQKVESAWQSFSANLRAVAEKSHVRVEHILHYLILHMMRELKELGVLSAAKEADIWTKLETDCTVKALWTTIEQMIEESLEAAAHRKSSDVLMTLSKDYIDKHLAKDVGVDEMADHLGISCSYFSLLFKQHFGETFVEYVTRQRMELAKSLLARSDKSVTQIGKMVGYAERRYFTKVFQKYVRLTPSEYREARQLES